MGDIRFVDPSEYFELLYLLLLCIMLFLTISKNACLFVLIFIFTCKFLLKNCLCSAHLFLHACFSELVIRGLSDRFFYDCSVLRIFVSMSRGRN